MEKLDVPRGLSSIIEVAPTSLRACLAAVLAASLTTACTMEGQERHAQASRSAQQCFLPSQVSGYTQAGKDRINVRTGPGDVYLFETFGGCTDLAWAEAIGFDSRGSTRICNGLDVTLIVPGTIGPRRCPVRMIRKLTPEEVRAR